MPRPTPVAAQQRSPWPHGPTWRIRRRCPKVREGYPQTRWRGGGLAVEVLSPCPVNWKMTPTDPRTWSWRPGAGVPLGVFPTWTPRRRPPESGDGTPAARRRGRGFQSLFLVEKGIDEVTRHVGEVDEQVRIAGLRRPGRDVRRHTCCQLRRAESLHATWLPSYGPEMPGGTATPRWWCPAADRLAVWRRPPR